MATPEETIAHFIEPIKIGETLHLKPQSDASQTKFSVKYLGGLDKASLICTLPMVDDKYPMMKENAAFSVSLFSGKYLYRFNTIIEIVLSRPYPHMHLKYPREIAVVKLRKNHRISTDLITAIHNKSNQDYADRQFTGRMVDLSMGGVLIYTNQPLGQEGDSIECSFKLVLDDQTATYAYAATLCKTSPPTEDTQDNYVCAVKFTDLSANNKALLSGYIYQQINGARLDEL